MKVNNEATAHNKRYTKWQPAAGATQAPLRISLMLGASVKNAQQIDTS